MDYRSPASNPPTTLWTALLADLERVATRDRWAEAFMIIGWIHLAFFLDQHLLFALGDVTAWHFVGQWFLEVAALLGVMRALAGPGWYRASPMAQVIVRVWGTFLILSFNLATLNELTGWTLDWFKPVWATLATFGFATMAWLVAYRFLIPAVQMYFTGLLMARYPAYAYLIHGLSWWVALQAIGISMILQRRARRRISPQRSQRTQREIREKEFQNLKA